MNRLFVKHATMSRIRIVDLEDPPSLAGPSTHATLSKPLRATLSTPLLLHATEHPTQSERQSEAGSRPEATSVKPGGIYAAVRAMHAMPRRAATATLVDASILRSKTAEPTQKPREVKRKRRLYDDEEEQDELRTSISLADDRESDDDDESDDWGSLADMIDDREYFSDDE